MQSLALIGASGIKYHFLFYKPSAKTFGVMYHDVADVAFNSQDEGKVIEARVEKDETHSFTPHTGYAVKMRHIHGRMRVVMRDEYDVSTFLGWDRIKLINMPK